MYELADYGGMIADRGRTSAYARALEARITPSSVVLDIGTDAGILALIACRARAARVYAVEPNDVIEVAREAAAVNGFADRIRFVQAASTDINLPERVDGIVAELHGTLPLFGNSMASIIDARTRFLKPGGWIVPARETVWAALASSASIHERLIGVWTTDYGVDLSTACVKAANQWRHRRLDAGDLLVEPRCWAALDYASLAGTNVCGDMAWTIEREAIGHGVCVWFEAETAPGIGYSNSPASSERHIFGQGFFPWPEPITLSTGNEVRVRLRADLIAEEYVWRWDTTVTDDRSNRVKTAHRQSSWPAAPMNIERLRKHADNFVPDLRDDARIDRHILDLMEHQRPLSENATQILNTFPQSFENWDAALTRVGMLSKRYSR